MLVQAAHGKKQFFKKSVDNYVTCSGSTIELLLRRSVQGSSFN
jgi:hypothetical protein